MYGYVYITTNMINNKKYIGQHKSTFFNEEYKGSGKYLCNALNKYGRDNFKVEILEECDSSKSLNDREAYWISYFNADNDKNFYNLTPGRGQGSGTNSPLYGKRGKDNPNYGSKRTTEQCRRISESKLGNKGIKGMISINNGEINKFIFPNDVDKYINSGWNLGGLKLSNERKEKLKTSIREALKNPSTIKKKSDNMKGNQFGLGNRSTKGMISITDGINNHYIDPSEFPKWESLGYHRGKTTHKHLKEVV